MEDKDKTIQLNTEDSELLIENTEPAEPAGVTDDTIEYTFVVPRGEVYVDPDLQPADPEDTADQEEAEQVIPEAEDSHEEADTELTSKQTSAKTIVVEQPDDEEEDEAEEEASGGSEEGGAEGEAEKEEKPADDENAGKKTRYGLPLDHPEMGELAKKQEARRRSAQNKKRDFRTRFYVITTTVIVLVGGFFFSISSFFTIDSIVVQGNSHYTAEEIINMGHATPGRNIIYKANTKEIKEYLEQNPYIKSAVVSRRLPSTLVIQVTERQERLAFRYDDDYLVMDENGILLKKTRNVPKTTIVEGLVVSKIKLGEKIGTENNKRLNKVIDLIKATIKNDLYFKKMDVSDEKIIKAYVYDTLVVKTTYEALEENIKNGRLHLVLENLFKESIERGTISFEEDGSASFMPII